ncbi:MAG TPA: hypothetical protein VIJ38_05445 [Acidobacteriaceae bacterium]
MKAFLTIALVALPSLGFSADSSLAFPEAKIDGPPLSLEQSAQQGVPSLVYDFRPVQSIIRISRMPIIAPETDCDPKLIVKPDATRDYKMTVISPDVGSQK